jgi:PilZ domain
MSAANRSFRRSDRLDVVLPARCRSRSGFVDRVTVVDISSEGCRIESFGLTLREGDLVVLTPQMLEGLCGTVRWTDGHSAGIEFATPLYGPVVEHLHREHGSFLPVYAAPAGGLRLAA